MSGSYHYHALESLTKVELFNMVAERSSLSVTGNGGIRLIKPGILFMLPNQHIIWSSSTKFGYRKCLEKSINLTHFGWWWGCSLSDKRDLCCPVTVRQFSERKGISKNALAFLWTRWQSITYLIWGEISSNLTKSSYILF